MIMAANSSNEPQVLKYNFKKLLPGRVILTMRIIYRKSKYDPLIYVY